MNSKLIQKVIDASIIVGIISIAWYIISMSYACGNSYYYNLPMNFIEINVYYIYNSFYIVATLTLFLFIFYFIFKNRKINITNKLNDLFILFLLFFLLSFLIISVEDDILVIDYTSFIIIPIADQKVKKISSDKIRKIIK